MDQRRSERRVPKMGIKETQAHQQPRSVDGKCSHVCDWNNQWYFDTEDYDPENTPDRYDAERLELEMENKERIPPEASNIESLFARTPPAWAVSYHMTTKS
jgi:hypothetical protein